MKKAILAISFLCYITLSCGVVVNLHFCMDRLASVHLFGSKPDRCGKCGMNMHKANDCCHDEQKVLKLEQDQVKLVVPDYAFIAQVSIGSSPDGYITIPAVTEREMTVPAENSPPILSEQDTYLQINVFRI